MSSDGFLTVQLLHELPDGSRHVDWMIAQDRRGEQPLVTFRVAGRVDGLAGGARLTAHRIDDHRPEYLVYEGPLSGDRGTVRRLARGMVVSWDRGVDVWRRDIDWPDPVGGLRRQSLRLCRQTLGGDAWVIEVAVLSRNLRERPGGGG